jgi:hypothetical protein
MASGQGAAASVRRALVRWWRAWRSRQAQDERSPTDPTVHALADAVLARADPASARAAARSDVARMMRYFGIEPAKVPPQFWDRLLNAERLCAQCVSIDRCQRWSYRQPTDDAPHLFCPNATLFAELFEEIAAGQREPQNPNDSSSG